MREQHRYSAMQNPSVPMRTAREAQAEMIRQCRAESCIGDPSIPIAINPAPPPIFGPTVAEYYRRKHQSGKCGRFYPLHLNAIRLDRHR
jgi:hypothetical protein